MITLSVEK